MITILLATLFAAATLGSGLVLADSAVRGRNAFRQLRGQRARLDAEPRITVAFVDFARAAELPAMRARTVSAAHRTRRPARSRVPSLHAAA